MRNFERLNKFIDGRYFSEIIMLVLFFGVSILIFMKSYFGGAYISPDSTNYLRAAQSILNGYGFRVYAEAGWNYLYFSHWPIGYPFLIACVSFITKTDVYLASKILTILTLAGIFGLLYQWFKKKAWIYALIMVCYPSFLTCFYYTWSEQLFLFGSLLLTFEIINIISENKPKLYHYFSILIACLLMFFVRYVGIQTIGIIGLVIIYFITVQIITKKSTLEKIIPLTVVVVVVSAVISGYFYLNYVNTGHITGDNSVHPRGSFNSLRYILESTIHLCRGQIEEASKIFQISFIQTLSAFVIMIFIFFQFKCSFKIKQLPLNALVLLIMSIFYVFAFLFFRAVTEVDQHYERHLLSSTILFAFYCIAIFLENKDDIFVEIRQFLQKRKVLSVCVLFVWFGAYPLREYTKSLIGFAKGTNVSYQQTKNEIINELSSVPSKSIIMTDYSHSKEFFASFIRTDLFVTGGYETCIDKYIELLNKFNNANNANNVYIYLDTEYVIPDCYDRAQNTEENLMLKDYLFSRKDKLIKVK